MLHEINSIDIPVASRFDPINFKLRRGHRVGIMISLITTFFVISPILLLYTSGYRYDFNAKKIKKTGSISIDIEPKDAQVYINDIRIKQSMPIRLNNRAHGTYKIRIEKEGFKTWEQSMILESNQTVYVKQTKLLKNRLPEYIAYASSTPLFLYASQGQEENFALFKHENGYEFVSLKNTYENELRSIERYEKEPEISLSPFHQSALVKIKKDYASEFEVLSLKNATKKIVHRSPAEIPVEWQWSKRDGEIYLRQASTIYKKDIYGLDKVLGASDAKIWYVEYPETVWLMKNQTLELFNDPKIHYELPADTFQIIDINQARIISRGSSGFSIIDRTKNSAEAVSHIGAEHLYFNEANNEWWVWSDFEFWKIQEKGEVELVNRYAKKITEIRPLNRFGLTLLADEAGLNAQNPGYTPTQNLYGAEEIKELEVSIPDQTIYFIGKLGKKEGLFQLEY